MRGTDESWQRWGKQDPYYGVASHIKFSREQLPDNIDEFFAGGEEFIEHSLRDAEKAFGAFSRNSALDFGCGVGRLTLPLARRFSYVIGIDISDAMLTEAQKNATNASLSNIEFAESDDGISNATGLYDFVNTYVVLQHIPPARGMVILDCLLRKVAPRGIAMIHVSIERKFSFLGSAAYLARNFVPGVRQILNLYRGLNFDRPTMQMNEYNLMRILEKFQAHGFEPVLIFLENHSGVTTARLIGQRSFIGT